MRQAEAEEFVRNCEELTFQEMQLLFHGVDTNAVAAITPSMRKHWCVDADSSLYLALFDTAPQYHDENPRTGLIGLVKWNPMTREWETLFNYWDEMFEQ